MSEEEAYPFERVSGPKIKLTAEPTEVEPGQPVVIHWHVTGAEEVRLWVSASLPDAPEPLDWVRIGEMGEPVPPEDRLEKEIEATTAFYLVAKGPFGLSGQRVIVWVMEEIEVEPKPEIWRPQKQFLPQMTEQPHVAWAGRPEVGELLTIPLEGLEAWGPGEVWRAGGKPTISLTASPQVIFTDETSTLSWKVTNATCITKSTTVYSSGLVVDTTQVSGTKAAGGGHGAGGMPACGAKATDSSKISGQTWGHGSQRHHLHASNAQGGSSAATRWLDVLTVPKYSGNATAARKAGIRAALKTVDTKLRNGAIYHDAKLDATVPAFKNGHLNRKGFWARLVREIENIGLDTFDCNDVSDKDFGAGYWKSYGNVIGLQWSPSHKPYLAYVIVHELIHKCGFADGLYKYGYSKMQIENMAHDVSGAVI